MRKHRIVTHAPRTKANSPITIYPNAVLPPKIVAAVSKPEEVPGSTRPIIPGMAKMCIRDSYSVVSLVLTRKIRKGKVTVKQIM